jgi:hypothetical protein
VKLKKTSYEGYNVLDDALQHHRISLTVIPFFVNNADDLDPASLAN